MLLEEASRRAGGHRWSELRLFEILGGWVASTEDVDAKLLFDRHSQHHAWRAEQWWDRLPVLADVDRDDLVEAPSPGVGAAMEALAGVQATVARLAGAYRVALPRLVRAYHEHRVEASPVSDGAAIRTLELLLADVSADWREGEVLLQRRLTGATEVEVAAAAVGGLEGLIVTPQR